MKPDRRRCGNNTCLYFSPCSLFILLYGASVNSILLFSIRGPNIHGLIHAMAGTWLVHAGRGRG